MTHALTHMNNPKITRATLPALLPIILAGLFILAACGGSVLPTDVTIAPTGTNTANKLDTNVPVAGFLGVGEQEEEQEAKSAPPANPPAVNPIVQVQKQVPKPAPAPKVPTPVVPKQVEKQIPAPVFEVAVAPARPPQRSFSQEPVTETETVTRSDATGESNHDDGKITFADWTASFTTAPPTTARATITETTIITEDLDIIGYISGYAASASVANIRNKAATGNVLTYTSDIFKNADGDTHADGDPIVFTRDKYGLFIFTLSERDYIVDNAVIVGTTTSGVKSQFLSGGTHSLDRTIYRTNDDGKLLNSDGELLNNDGVFTEEGEEPLKVASWTTGIGRLNLATATHGDVALGGDAADGVEFFHGFIGGFVGDQINYAGLLSGTDLGAPLVVEAGKTAEWKGHLLVIGYATLALETDFMLTVDFSSNRTLTASTRVGTAITSPHHFLLEGTTYDANGVITGKILVQNKGNFVNGVVTGLIGEQGAVAAILSTDDTASSKNDIKGTNSIGATSYVGGFVARPTPPTPPVPPVVEVVDVVDVSDLTGYATIPTVVANLVGDSRFLRIADGTSLDTTGIASPAENPNLPPAILTIRRDYTAKSAGFGDGYAFIHPQGYAAILPTTDLGIALPINASQLADAKWEGTYSLTHSALNAPITFIVDFTTGALTGTADIQFDAFDLAGKTITIDATFGAEGVLDGTFKTEAGRELVEGDTPLINAVDTDVIGLIGAEGLVGIMHGQNTDGDVFAGGFIALPEPTPVANYAAWLKSFDETLPTAGRHTAGLDSQFLQSNEAGDGLNFGDVVLRFDTLNPNGAPIRDFRTLTMDDNINNGVSFFTGSKGERGSFNPRFFAGMLSGTNVGAPLAVEIGKTAVWKGKIQWVGFLNGVTFPGNNQDARVLDLEVNFENREIVGFVKIDDRNHHLLLEAGYNSRGIFTNGTVKYGIFAGADRTATRTADGPQANRQFDRPFDGTLTGIIGSGGAVGVFINDQITEDYGFAGGFWAVPPSE